MHRFQKVVQLALGEVSAMGGGLQCVATTNSVTCGALPSTVR